MYNTEEYINIIKGHLSEYRFYHSMCVAESAKELAKRFGADEEKAYVAGILHDVMKEEGKKEQRKIIEKAGMTITEFEKDNKKFYHQISGAAFMQTDLGITDKDMLSAVRYHTTGRRGMSLLEQILYLADFISADRDYDDVDIMRKKVDEGRQAGMLYAMRYTIVYHVNKGKPLHLDTVDAYNWVIESIKKECE